MVKKSDWAQKKAERVLGEWHMLTYAQLANHLRAAERRCVPTEDRPEYMANEADIAAQIREAIEQFAREAAAKLRECANAKGMGMGLINREGLRQATAIVEALAQPLSPAKQLDPTWGGMVQCCDLASRGHRDGCPGKPQACSLCGVSHNDMHTEECPNRKSFDPPFTGKPQAPDACKHNHAHRYLGGPWICAHCETQL